MFSPPRLKIHLKLCINRLKLLRAKKEALALQSRREISLLLTNNKIESAKIRVEGIIRDDDFREALEILELYCELLLARFGLLEANGAIETSLTEAVHSLVYATARCGEVKELAIIRDQIGQKVGKEAYLAMLNNTENLVSPKIVNKLLANPPNPILVDRYLEEIGQRYNVPGWGGSNSSPPPPPNQQEELILFDEAPMKPSSKRDDSTLSDDLLLPTPPSTSTPTMNQTNNITAEKPPKPAQGGGIPTFEELELRFKALKQPR